MDLNYQIYSKALLDSNQLNLSKYFKLFDLNKLSIFILHSQHSIASGRLGHVAEKLFFDLVNEVYQDKKVLTNIQIIENKVTLGELDLILYDDQKLSHIEFCYKFYLLDENEQNDEFHNWIGPNRRDALYLKVNKLTTKQLPIINQLTTKKVLEQIIPNFSNLIGSQQVCFLAQLYVHYSKWTANWKTELGEITGFYISHKEIERIKGKWYIPKLKHEWLLPPQHSVEWLNKNELKEKLVLFHKKNSNPLCWLRKEDGELVKCFIVNWESV